MPKSKVIAAGAGAAAIVTAAVILPNANASQSDQAQTEAKPKVMTASAAQTLASQLEGEFGSSLAGVFWDKKTGNLSVNVVDGANSNDVSAKVKQAGAVPRRVKNSTSDLQAGAKTLKAKATIPGTAWSVDPKTNQIQVTADSTVTGDKWSRLKSTVKSLGSGMAQLQKTTGTLKTFANGGDAIFGGNARCSLGFNVKESDGSPAFLTAGHCGVDAKTWSDSQTGNPIATVEAATFPGKGDFSLVKYDDPATKVASEVNTGKQTVAITAAAEPTVGLEVERMGSTTGLNGGKVTALDATVNYQEGSVTGLIQTDVCAEPGDSGGSLFTKDGKAIGLTSGGSGDCTAGGTTFFQPVSAALKATGATLGGGQPPCDPQQQANPADPGNKVNPADPGNKVNPADPGNKVNPADPGNKVNPADPGNKVNPADPGNKVNPADPGNKANPPQQCDPQQPGGGQKPGDRQKPGGGQKPGDRQQPGGGQKPGGGQNPGDPQQPGGRQKPGDPQQPGGGQKP